MIRDYKRIETCQKICEYLEEKISNKWITDSLVKLLRLRAFSTQNIAEQKNLLEKMSAIASKDNSYCIKLQEIGIYSYCIMTTFNTEKDSLDSYRILCKLFEVPNELRLTYPFTFETKDVITMKDEEKFLK